MIICVKISSRVLNNYLPCFLQRRCNKLHLLCFNREDVVKNYIYIFSGNNIVGLCLVWNKMKWNEMKWKQIMNVLHSCNGKNIFSRCKMESSIRLGLRLVEWTFPSFNLCNILTNTITLYNIWWCAPLTTLSTNDAKSGQTCSGEIDDFDNKNALKVCIQLRLCAIYTVFPLF